jgi:hypothetical protein
VVVSSAIFDVRAFGAVGDGEHLDSDAINEAILKAHAAGGGTVYVPAGTFLVYSIRLKSNLTLHLERGSVLLAAGDPPPGHEEILAMLTPEGTLPGGGSGDSGSFYAGDIFGLDEPAAAPPCDRSTPSHATPPPTFEQAMKSATRGKAGGGAGYDPPEPNPHDQYQDHGHSHWHNSLIWGVDLENVAIVGGGMIDGRGLTWNADPANPTGNKSVALKNCRNVLLRDLTFFRGGHFVVLMTGCDSITIDNIRIDTNRDGIDIDCSRNVSITNCAINSPNDDAIVLKSSYALGEARPTEHVTISNCRLSAFDMGSMLDGTYRTTQTLAPDRGGVTGRIKFGTESNGGFRNIAISNCAFLHCRGLAIETVDGGAIEDVVVTNITMRDVTTAPLFVRLGGRLRGPAGISPGIVRRITISNVAASDVDPRYATLFSGIPGHLIEDLRLSNIHIRYRGGGGRMDAAVQVPEREKGYPDPNMFGIIPACGLYFRHVKNLHVHDVSLAFDKPDKRPAVVLEDVENALFVQLEAATLTGVPMFSYQGVKKLIIRHSGAITSTQVDSINRGTM